MWKKISIDERSKIKDESLDINQRRTRMTGHTCTKCGHPILSDGSHEPGGPMCEEAFVPRTIREPL